MSKETRNCKFCGKEFSPKVWNQYFCSKHHLAKCEICGKEKLIKNSKIYQTEDGQLISRVACSKECTKKKTEATNIEKYGAANVFASDYGKQKIKETNLKKYGVENVFQEGSLIRKEINQKNLELYGVEYPLQSKEIQEKIEQTNLEKLGVRRPFESQEVQDRVIQSNMENYGVKSTFELEDVKEKSKETSLRKFGTYHPMQSDIVKERAKQTNRERFGTDWGVQNEEIKAKINQSLLDNYGKLRPAQFHIDHIEDWDNLEDYLSRHDREFTCLDLAEYFSVSYKSMRIKINVTEVQDLVKDFYKLSHLELEFKDRVEREIPGVKLTVNDRKLIQPLELDFYFPDHRLAVEISPTFTHKLMSDEDVRGVDTKDYHYNKFKLCEEQGVELITVFEWEDQDKVFELVKNKLTKSEERIYARKCTIKFTDSVTRDHKEFLDKYHVLGRVNNKRGAFVEELTYKDEVLGLAVFYPYRDNQLELKRLAFKDSITITGGASKLVKNAGLHRPTTDKIITFSDNNLGTGSVYKTIGFNLIEENKYSLNFHNIKYNWVIKDTSLWMVGADRLLKNFPGYEPVGTGEDLPGNQEIVMSCGFLPVYDCGYRKWELNLKN